MITLLRHGQTEWNDREITQGQRDIPLDNTGREQARAVRQWLQDTYDTIDGVYASDLSRAAETAALAVPELATVEDQRLREQNFGEEQGHNREEWLADNPSFRAKQEAAENRYAVQWPNGESTYDVRDRVFAALDEITDAHAPDDTVVVIAHATPLICAQAYFKDIPLQEAAVVENCTGFLVDRAEQAVQCVNPLDSTQ